MSLRARTKFLLGSSEMGKDNFSFENRRKEMEKKAKKEEKKKRKLAGDATPASTEETKEAEPAAE